MSNDPPVVPLDALEDALAAGDEFFIPAPLGSRGAVREAVWAAAGRIGVRATVGPAWGGFPHRDGGGYLHVTPSARPPRRVS